VSEELAAALAGPVEQFSQMLTCTAQEASVLDHGDRETQIAQSEAGTAAAAAAVHAHHRFRLRGADRAGHQCCGGPARHRGERP
jgi:hypothetical protein